MERDRLVTDVLATCELYMYMHVNKPLCMKLWKNIIVYKLLLQNNCVYMIGPEEVRQDVKQDIIICHVTKIKYICVIVGLCTL